MTQQDDNRLTPINHSPVWRRVEGLSVNTAVFSPAPDSPQDTYLDVNTSETFLAKDFHHTEWSQNSLTNSGSGSEPAQNQIA
jgi:hypothetical protein